MMGGKQKYEISRDMESNARMSCVDKKWVFINKIQPQGQRKVHRPKLNAKDQDQTVEKEPRALNS